MNSPIGQAHPYVDIVHRASLMYAFASLVVWKFAELSTLGDAVELWAVIALVGYFGIAIATYFVHALLKDTDNQLRAPFRLGNATVPRPVDRSVDVVTHRCRSGRLRRAVLWCRTRPVVLVSREVVMTLQNRVTPLADRGGRMMMAAVATASAEDATTPASGDPRVVAALKAAGLAYSLDEGDFRLEYDVDQERSQRAWVASETARIDRLEIRDVWSVAARGKGDVPEDLARMLLKENVRMILGAWQVNQSQDEYLVVFLAQVDAAADAATLREVIEVVMFSADRIEKQLSDKDAF